VGTRRLAALSVLALSVGALAGCGSGGVVEGVVARVGGQSITKPMLDHWMSAMAGGKAAHDPVALGQRTLDFLISSDWVIGEGAALHVTVSATELQRRLHERMVNVLALSEAEYREALRKTGRTLADARREAEVELISAKIQSRAQDTVGNVSQAQLADYYRRNIARFTTGEVRYFDIDNLPNLAAALRAKRQVQAGAVFAGMTYHEMLDRAQAYRNPAKKAIEKEIFAARPGVLSGPVKLYDGQSLFEVTRIVPAAPQPLAKVRATVEKELLEERGQRALRRFIASWRSRWTAQTDCSPGFVVQKCRQYTGPRTAESSLTLD